jgi:hypothetical protein
MINFKKLLALQVLLCCTAIIGYGQFVGLRFKSNNPMAQNILNKITNLNTNTCDITGYDVGKLGEILVFRKIDNNRYAVLLEENDDGGNFAKINQNYCISTANLKDLFNPKGTLDHGVLSVPFKFRYDPVKIMAGGELGYYIGRRWGRTSVVSHAGFSPISLNDVNSDVPETKLGLTFGIGLVYRLTEEFQVGIIEGQDFFEGVESWTYKYKPWISLTVGYAFLKPNKSDVEKANTSN